LPLNYLITRFKKPSAGAWMPQTWAELECKETDLSAECLQAISSPREAFKRLGYTEVGFKKLKRVLSPLYRDDGGINFLDSSRRHFGQLLYVKMHAPPPISTDRKQVSIAFTSVFPDSIVSYTNNTKSPFGPVPKHETLGVPSADVADIYRRFVEHLKREKEDPRSFPDLQSLQSWFDSDGVEVFEYRVRRGYFIRMTDDEVAAVRCKLPPVLPN